MHLFAGAGGGLLADLILGHRPVVAVEWDAYCCRVLRERAADGWFPGLQVWEGDVRLFNPSKYAGSVDCIHAGFPCTDLSVAGARAGIGESTRSGLYREAIRVAGAVRPRWIFLENVANINSSGVGAVYGDLAALGYEYRAICLLAADVGAPHNRDRWWCLARRTDTNGIGELQPQGGQQKERGWAGNMGGEISDADSQRPQQRGASDQQTGQHESAHFCAEMPDTFGQRLERQHQARTTPWTANRSGHGNYPGWWEVEPALGRVADGVAGRTHRIKALGNGQVPLQAATAFWVLEQLF
ncbi:MAG: DNA cytosine methyltransferase [Thiothrix sp.]|nr:DNA cytosine methyltransferase [Thiothrix sp.]